MIIKKRSYQWLLSRFLFEKLSFVDVIKIDFQKATNNVTGLLSFI